MLVPSIRFAGHYSSIPYPAHRHTSSTVYSVIEGSGHGVIDRVRFDWAAGDFFMIPPWTWHEHANTADKDAIVDALRLYREEALADGGHQDVTSTFEPLTLD